MKLGTWSSKLKAVRRNLARFWPVSVCFTLFLLLLVFSVNPEYSERLWEYPDFEPVLVSALGFVAALLLFGDLFTARYATATHAFPVTRKQLFWERVISGLVMGLLPAVLSFGIAALYLKDLEAPILWMCYVIPCWVYGLALGSFSAVLSGSWFGTVCTAFLFSFGIPLTEATARYVSEALLVGTVAGNIPYSGILCPIIAFVNMGNELSVGTSLFALGESLVFFAAALLLYLRRKLESAGDFLAFPWMKVVMKAFISLTGGIGLGIIFESVLGLDYGIFSLGRTLAWLLPGVLLATLAAEMIVEKTIRVFGKKRLMRYGLYLVLTAGISALLWWDPVGIQTRVPEQEEIIGVEIKVDEIRFSATSAEAVAAVRELHQAVLAERFHCGRNHSHTNVTFTYTLNNGATVHREYHLFLYGDDIPLAMTHPLDVQISDFINEPRWAISCLLRQELTAKSAEGVLANQYSLQDPVSIVIRDCVSNLSVTLSPNQQNILLYNLWKDMEADTTDSILYRTGYDTNGYELAFSNRNPSINGLELYWVNDRDSYTGQYLDQLFQELSSKP